MSNLNKIDFDISGIGKFMSNHLIYVPTYQRAYAWEEKNTEEILNDIDESQPDDYFIGSIVITQTKDEGVWEVVDGQQRLATMTIFFAAVRDFLNDNGENKRAEKIERDYISDIDLITTDPIPKIKLGNDDNDYFLSKIIKNDKSKKELKESHIRINKSYYKSYNFISNKFKLNNNKYDAIFNMIEFIKEKVKIIVVKVPDESNAFTVFETLNDRGLALSQADLIKNYLFNKAGTRIQEAQSYWLEMSGAIEAAQDEEEIIRYIRYLWSSKNGLTREKELFQEIKNKNTNQNVSVSFLEELKSSTNKYLALLNHNHPFWNTYTKTTKEYIEKINGLGLYQNKPLLLAILNQFKPKEVEKSFKIVLSWSVRNLITGSIPAGTLEKEFSNQAKLINDGNIKDTKSLLLSIKKIIPTDDQFLEEFSIATVTKNTLAQYYLVEIEKYLEKDKKVDENFDNVNIEHILPQVIVSKKDWPDFNEEQHKSLYKRLGNLTLLNTKVNSDLKSSNFNKKKLQYGQSKITITKNLKSIKKWSPDEIKNRQDEFAKIALKIWSLKI
jgi:uncharacterized protein with ParB-like and HNH nuclease domain